MSYASDPTMTTVLLQGEPLDGLISESLSAGYAQVVDEEAFRFAEAMKGTLIRRPDRPWAVRQALAALLLYDDVLIDVDQAWFGAVGVDALLKEELVRILPESSSPYARAMGKRRWEEPVFTALGFYRPLLLPRLYRLLKSSGTFEVLDRVCEDGGAKPTYNIRRRFTEALYDFVENGQDLERMKEARSLGAALFLPWCASRAFIREPEDMNRIYVQLVRSLVLDCHYLDYSARTQIFVVGDYRARARTRQLVPQVETQRLESYGLYRLAGRKLGLPLPRLASIEDVLRLREEPTIRRLRQRLDAFGKALQTRNGDELELAIQEIQDANASLRRTRRPHRWAQLATYLSLPVAVGELWLGLPVVGPTLAAIGFGAQTVVGLRELRHDWVLFGR